MEETLLDDQKTLAYALKRLSTKSFLSKDLKEALRKRGFSEESIAKAIDECFRLGYLSDAAWHEGFIRSQIRKKAGPQAILMKLMAKGVSKEEAKKALGAFDIDQAEMIKALLTTRYRSRDLENPKEKEKVIASLLRKGFSLEQVLTCLKQDAPFH